jgi:hypothetical protein
MTFITEWKHTNIVIVNVPNRYDLGHDSVSTSKKRKIVRYNEKLYRLLNPYSHVSIVEVSSNTDHYTKHGLHLNKYGKEELAKQIAVQINSAKGLAKSVDIPIPLQWNENREEDVSTNMVELAKIACDNLRRTSARNKKTPITRNKDFLWEVPTSVM